MSIQTATPAKHFAKPPYRAELFDAKSKWSGVMNRDGVNCLTFTDKPGSVVTDFESAQQIAADWNGSESK